MRTHARGVWRRPSDGGSSVSNIYECTFLAYQHLAVLRVTSCACVIQIQSLTSCIALFYLLLRLSSTQRSLATVSEGPATSQPYNLHVSENLISNNHFNDDAVDWTSVRERLLSDTSSHAMHGVGDDCCFVPLPCADTCHSYPSGDCSSHSCSWATSPLLLSFLSRSQHSKANALLSYQPVPHAI